jgi:short-subunit dehydrogenase
MGRLAVITGGTKGIGRALCNRFAGAGFAIATCSRKKEDLERLRAELEAAHGVQVWCFVANLAVAAEARRFSDEVAALPLPADVLVNNAGFFMPGSVLDEPAGNLEAMMAANVYSAYHTTRGIGAQMKARRQGHIFNMCSIASIQAYPDGGSYAMAKFALLGFSKVLREELKTHGVRVTAVLPGATRTASWDGVDLPDERFMKPEDVAQAVLDAHALSARTVVEEILLRPQLGDI